MSRETFCLLFAAAIEKLKPDYTLQQIGVYLQLHPLTMQRYVHGEAAIHDVGREPVVRALVRLMKAPLAFQQLMLEHGISTGCSGCDYETKNGEVGPYTNHSCEEQ